MWHRFWEWALRFDAATILRKAYGPDTGVLFLRTASPRVGGLLEDARKLNYAGTVGLEVPSVSGDWLLVNSLY